MIVKGHNTIENRIIFHEIVGIVFPILLLKVLQEMWRGSSNIYIKIHDDKMSKSSQSSTDNDIVLRLNTKVKLHMFNPI